MSSSLGYERNSYKVLSIQSHVVFGYVGNKSSTFPLQVLGFEVDAINSVQLSNHTGYDFVKGQVLQQKDLADVFDGLRQNNLLANYSHLLTGYIGNASFLREIAVIVKELRDANPNLVYVCDPVMGDEGKMYVPKELLPIYRDEILPLCNIATPNQYELELLTGQTIKTEADARNSMNFLHDKGIKIVALSSSELGPAEELWAFLSVRDASDKKFYKIIIPKQGGDISFTGSGDLFAALFLAHSTTQKNIGEAFEKTIGTLQSVLRRTIKSIPDEVLKKQRKITSSDRELKLIQSKNDIENPEIHLAVREV